MITDNRYPGSQYLKHSFKVRPCKDKARNSPASVCQRDLIVFMFKSELSMMPYLSDSRMIHYSFDLTPPDMNMKNAKRAAEWIPDLAVDLNVTYNPNEIDPSLNANEMYERKNP